MQVSENVEIKIAPGMVTDLYTSPETEKNILAALAAKETGIRKVIGLVSNIVSYWLFLCFHLFRESSYYC